MARRAAGALCLVIALIAGPAGAVTAPRQEARWRHRVHAPPLPHPEILHPVDPSPLPSGFVMTIRKPDGAPLADAELHRPREIAERIAECWSPAAETDDVTIRAQFSRGGTVIGEPRVTHVGVAPDEAARRAMAEAIRAALARCAPLRFTASLGAAIAGYPFAIRFVAGGALPNVQP
jgi:hypothetical protein